MRAEVGVALPLAELVATSAAVAAVGGRLEKIDRLATLAGPVVPDEVAVSVAFLTGSTRQGRSASAALRSAKRDWRGRRRAPH
jgi:hypothetical protein